MRLECPNAMCEYLQRERERERVKERERERERAQAFREPNLKFKIHTCY